MGLSTHRFKLLTNFHGLAVFVKKKSILSSFIDRRLNTFLKHSFNRKSIKNNIQPSVEFPINICGLSIKPAWHCFETYSNSFHDQYPHKWR